MVNVTYMGRFNWRRLRSRRSPLLALIACVAVILLICRSASTDSMPESPRSQRPLQLRIAIDSLDPAYRPIMLDQTPLPPFPRLEGSRRLPLYCLEAWLARGDLECGYSDIGPEEQLDVSWLWVNGSDERWRTEMQHWRSSHGIYSPDHHYRDNNELVYSMRSALAALSTHLHAVHLVLYDFAFDGGTDAKLIPKSLASNIESIALNDFRIAQTPTWLSNSNVNLSRSPQLHYAVHSEIFHRPTLVEADQREELEWRQNALPSFNSMSIESRLGWLPGLSEVSIAMNDDLFMLLPHAVSDFHSTLYGNVALLDSGWYQQARPVLDKSRVNDAGQIGGLYHANFILSQRFPKRPRAALLHGPKVVSRELLHETNLMFYQELSLSSSRRFRELFTGDGDVHMLWLTTHLRIERWREALLWVYAVAHVGSTGGVWDEGARHRLSLLLGTEAHKKGTAVTVLRGKRTTIAQLSKVFDLTGHSPPLRTNYIFSSLDGHLPPIIEPGRDPAIIDKCIFDMDRCLGAFWTNGEAVAADSMFKRLAFEQPQCGDCLIMALVRASGETGLSAFFPSSNKVVRTSRDTGECGSPPHLPLTPTWKEADFSLRNVLSSTTCPGAKVHLREYTLQLLSRYLYVSGHTNEQFHMLQNAEQVRQIIETVDNNPNTSLLGLNDDVEPAHAEEVKVVLGQWLQSRWPTPAPWERQ